MQILNFLYILLVISNFLVPLHPIISTEHRNGFVNDSRFGYVCLRDCMAFPYADNRI